MDIETSRKSAASIAEIKTPRSRASLAAVVTEAQEKLEAIREFSNSLDSQATELEELIEELAQAEKDDWQDYSESVRVSATELGAMLG